jgi:hypothetical protein
MAITTLSSVKTILGITVNTYDARITAMIPYVEQKYLDIRNAPWDTLSGEIVYPSGSDITAAYMIKYKLQIKDDGTIDTSKNVDFDLQSETIDSYSYSRSTNTRVNGFPKEIVSDIKRYIRGA